MEEAYIRKIVVRAHYVVEIPFLAGRSTSSIKKKDDLLVHIAFRSHTREVKLQFLPFACLCRDDIRDLKRLWIAFSELRRLNLEIDLRACPWSEHLKFEDRGVAREVQLARKRLAPDEFPFVSSRNHFAAVLRAVQALAFRIRYHGIVRPIRSESQCDVLEVAAVKETILHRGFPRFFGNSVFSVPRLRTAAAQAHSRGKQRQ